MDSDQLRLVLLVLGIVLVAGIYLRDRVARRRDRPPQARSVSPSLAGKDEAGVQPAARRARAEDDVEPFIGAFPSPGRDEPMAGDEESGGPPPTAEGQGEGHIASVVDEAYAEADTMEAPHLEPSNVSPPVKRDAEALDVGGGWGENLMEAEPQFTLDLSFNAHGDSDYLSIDPDLYDDVPRMIVQINLVAGRGRQFAGPLICKALAEVDLVPGDMDIYHRRVDNGGGQVLFSLASIVEPGTFPLDDMTAFESPGLTLFTQLPGARDGLAIYSDMLFTAQRLAVLLQGKLQDETHSALTKQAIEHTRERILEHRRQLQLLRSRTKK